jgi:iron-sulfur cluster assembly accessory protein
MLEVTSGANEKLVEYMVSNKITSALRVFVNQGGCSGPALGLALDEQKENDMVFSKEPLVFLVEEALLKQCGTITVDYINGANHSGFSVKSTMPLPGATGCNPDSCGSGRCGC